MKLKGIECLDMDLRKVWKLLHERRAVSTVVSSVILTGAVIAVSFVVLFWAQYRSSAYNAQYSEAMNADIAKLKERLAFEYVFYNSSAKNLSVYIMNCGRINKTSVQTVYVSNATWFFRFSSINLKFLNGNNATGLDMGEEGYFVLPFVSPSDSLVTGKSYSIKIITGRGSTFDHTFIA